MGAEPGTGSRCSQKLFIPKKRMNRLSEETLAELRAEFGTTSETALPRLPSSTSTRADNAGWKICPFCQEPMPDPMSQTLHALVQQWVQKVREGEILRPTDTLAVCQRHRDEYDIIPEGRRQGWPLSLDFRELRRRITDPNERYMRILQDRLLEPEHSSFFQEARQIRERMGKKAHASAHQIEYFDQQQCG